MEIREVNLRPEWTKEIDKIIDEKRLNWSGFTEYWMEQERRVILLYPGNHSKAMVIRIKNQYIGFVRKKIKELYESGELQKMVESGEIELYKVEELKKMVKSGELKLYPLWEE